MRNDPIRFDRHFNGKDRSRIDYRSHGEDRQQIERHDMAKEKIESS